MEKYFLWGLIFVAVVQSFFILNFLNVVSDHEKENALLDESNNDLLKTVKNYEESEDRLLARILDLENTVMGFYRNPELIAKSVESEIRADYGTDAPPLLSYKNKLVH